MPVDELLVSGVVPHVDADGLADARSQQRAGHLAVVGERFHDAARGEIERELGDPQRNISVARNRDFRFRLASWKFMVLVCPDRRR
jgi:hypothetical protein